MYTRRRALLLGVATLSLLGIGVRGQAQNGNVPPPSPSPSPSFAPLNPAFVQQHQAAAQGFSLTPLNFGLRHSPLNLSNLNGPHYFPEVLAASMPTTYDLRTLNRVTAIGNQGSSGCCWAFATIGSLESFLMPTQSCSFSENNLKNLSGFDFGANNGGNRDMSTAYFARWNGPVNTADDPYNPTSTSSPTVAARKHVQDVLFLPDRANSTDNNTIKQAVMTYGGMMTYIYIDYSAFSADQKSYYTTGGTATNHAVDIVGWDDNYDKGKFARTPAGNGAFLCRNSWGTSFADGGYFWVSYYDKWIGTQGGNTIFDSAEDVSDYSGIYQYDPLGCTTSMGWPGANKASFANIFSATSNDSIAAVSFFTLATNTTYTVSLYTGVTGNPVPANATPVFTQNGSISVAGYHTVSLSTPVPMTTGQKFSVVVSVAAQGNYLVPLESPFSGYSSKATASPGQSFFSLDGKSWTDATSYAANSNVCLKAFSKPTPITTVATPTFSPDGGTYTQSQTVTINCATSGATIHYTTNGNDPQSTDPVYSAPITISQTQTLKAKAWSGTLTPSTVKSATYTIAPAVTSLTVPNVSAPIGSKVTLSATLQTTSPSAALSGKTVSFSLNGTSVGTGVTDSKGNATCSVQLSATGTAGTQPITASYAGENGYKAASGSGTLTVTRLATKLTAANATGKPGTSVNLVAVLTSSASGSALSGKTITFAIGKTTLGTATTDAKGNATYAYTIPKTAALNSTTAYTATFAADTVNDTSTATANIIVPKQ